MSFKQQLVNARGELTRHEFCHKISNGLLNQRTYESWEQGREEPKPFLKWLLLRRIEHVFKIKIKESK